MTIKVMKHAGRTYMLTAITALVFSTTSCEPCKFGCPEEVNTNTKNEEQIQKRQEKLAALDKPYGTETGMIFGFSDGKNSEKETATETVESPSYKDLSFRYALPGNECPFNIQSAHAQFLAGPNINFKSAGDDVYANGSHKPGIGF